MNNSLASNTANLSFNAVTLCFALVVIVLVFRSLYFAYATPLRHVPGPSLAKFTRLWLAKAINSREYQKIGIQLHRKYGPIVRIAPNEYSIDDPQAVQVIYRVKHQLLKDGRYEAWASPGAEPDLFPSLDPEHHAWRRRQVLSLYQVGALADIESQVEPSMALFLEKMAEFARKDIVIDMAEWVQLYTFHAIGAITFGRPFDSFEKGNELTDMNTTVHGYSRYGAVMGVFIEWHSTVFKVLKWMTPDAGNGMIKLRKFATICIADWNRRMKNEMSLGGDISESGNIHSTDILGSMLARHQKKPETFSVEDAYYHVVTPIIAGGEPTGIAMNAAFYFLCRHPKVMEKLRKEVKEFKARSTNTYFTVKDAQQCPYLQAVIKEALRLFPGVGLNLSRVIPPGGLMLAGQMFPEGTVVGVNGWVAHVNQSVFGPDADDFRPERWLDADEASAHKMEQNILTFGRGPRSCLGKNISLMEMQKLIPEFVLRFDISFADPKRDWSIYNDFFVKQEDFLVKVREIKADE